MKLSKFRALLWVLLSILFLGSCSITERLFAIRGQMCEFDRYVVLNIDEQVEVVLQEPVLLERDVYMLMDAVPTNRSSSSEGVVASYVFEQLQLVPDGKSVETGMELEFSFVFIQTDGKLRLSRITSSGIPPQILASAAIFAASSATMAQQACDVSINPFKRSAVIAVDREMLHLIPNRRTAIALLGQPVESTENSNHLVYQFRLKGTQKNRPVVRIDADYDDSGNHLERAKATFTRYDAEIDVPQGTVLLTLNR